MSAADAAAAADALILQSALHCTLIGALLILAAHEASIQQAPNPGRQAGLAF